jgi:hypothetical protein
MIVNAFFVWLNWRIADWCFENDNPGWGWANIFFSAYNGAIIAFQLSGD